MREVPPRELHTKMLFALVPLNQLSSDFTRIDGTVFSGTPCECFACRALLACSGGPRRVHALCSTPTEPHPPRYNRVCRCGAGAGAPFWAGSSLRPPPRARPAPADGLWSCSPLPSCLRSFPALCSRRWLHRHGQLQHQDSVIVGRRHSLRRYVAFVGSASVAAPDQ